MKGNEIIITIYDVWLCPSDVYKYTFCTHTQQVSAYQLVKDYYASVYS